jgi:hypothetical protein
MPGPERPDCRGWLVSAILFLAAGAQAQCPLEWVPQLSHRWQHAAAYDSLRGEVLIYGGEVNSSRSEEMWRHRAGKWTRVPTPAGPTPGPRLMAAMAYDSTRGRLVLYGGWASATEYPDDTWEYDGAQWVRTPPLPGGSPGPRYGHTLIYDRARQRTVLFGGMDSTSTHHNSLWEWDGHAWTERPIKGPLPPARSLHAMVFDAARGRGVLFGGASASALFGDTWELDGSAWVHASTSGPEPRRLHAMAYDSVRSRTVLAGGWRSDAMADTWEWDGAGWVQIPAAQAPPRLGHAMVFDAGRERSMLIAGFNNAPRTGVWEFDGSAWVNTLSDSPRTTVTTAMAYDSQRDRIVLFGPPEPSAGGTLSGTTWERAGDRWSIAAVHGPPARNNAALAYDEARSTMVLFGGSNSASGLLNDTWTWDGSTWTQHHVPAPLPRQRTAMVYQPHRQRVVLFGGAGNNLMADTWEWDGSSWMQRSGAAPAARQSPAMTYDPVRQVTLLQGGSGLNAGHQTWEWDGDTWINRTTDAPGQRRQHGMAYNALRGRIMLFGGLSGSGVMGDAWEWTGDTWVSLPMQHGPGPRSDFGMVQTARGITLHGGLSFTETWDLVLTDCYANCDCSSAEPRLNIDDFTCFINQFAAGSVLPHAQQIGHYANCDGSTQAPALNIDDFTCFINLFAAGCP